MTDPKTLLVASYFLLSITIQGPLRADEQKPELSRMTPLLIQRCAIAVELQRISFEHQWAQHIATYANEFEDAAGNKLPRVKLATATLAYLRQLVADAPKKEQAILDLEKQEAGQDKDRPQDLRRHYLKKEETLQVELRDWRARTGSVKTQEEELRSFQSKLQESTDRHGGDRAKALRSMGFKDGYGLEDATWDPDALAVKAKFFPKTTAIEAEQEERIRRIQAVAELADLYKPPYSDAEDAQTARRLRIRAIRWNAKLAKAGIPHLERLVQAGNSKGDAELDSLVRQYGITAKTLAIQFSSILNKTKQLDQRIAVVQAKMLAPVMAKGAVKGKGVALALRAIQSSLDAVSHSVASHDRENRIRLEQPVTWRVSHFGLDAHMLVRDLKPVAPEWNQDSTAAIAGHFIVRLIDPGTQVQDDRERRKLLRPQADYERLAKLGIPALAVQSPDASSPKQKP